MPIVYNEAAIAAFWGKRPGELASRWTRFAAISGEHQQRRRRSAVVVVVGTPVLAAALATLAAESSVCRPPATTAATPVSMLGWLRSRHVLQCVSRPISHAGTVHACVQYSLPSHTLPPCALLARTCISKYECYRSI